MQVGRDVTALAGRAGAECDIARASAAPSLRVSRASRSARPPVRLHMRRPSAQALIAARFPHAEGGDVGGGYGPEADKAPYPASGSPPPPTSPPSAALPVICNGAHSSAQPFIALRSTHPRAIASSPAGAVCGAERGAHTTSRRPIRSSRVRPWFSPLRGDGALPPRGRACMSSWHERPLSRRVQTAHASRQRPNCSLQQRTTREENDGEGDRGRPFDREGIASGNGVVKASSPKFFHLAAHLQRELSPVTRAR